MPAHQLTFALGEALAHLHKLWFDGLLVRLQDDDGVLRFVRRDGTASSAANARVASAA